jgi:hypothetical protein
MTHPEFNIRCGLFSPILPVFAIISERVCRSAHPLGVLALSHCPGTCVAYPKDDECREISFCQILFKSLN